MAFDMNFWFTYEYSSVEQDTVWNRKSSYLEVVIILHIVWAAVFNFLEGLY